MDQPRPPGSEHGNEHALKAERGVQHETPRWPHARAFPIHFGRTSAPCEPGRDAYVRARHTPGIRHRDRAWPGSYVYFRLLCGSQGTISASLTLRVEKYSLPADPNHLNAYRCLPMAGCQRRIEPVILTEIKPVVQESISESLVLLALALKQLSARPRKNGTLERNMHELGTVRRVRSPRKE
jgi:hypothetical protein